MRNIIYFASQLLCLYNFIDICFSNHLKIRHICQHQHIDITQASGVKLEDIDESYVSIRGMRFPNSSSDTQDILSIQFRTTSPNGLLLNGESNEHKHGLSVWLLNSELRVRVRGHCSWVRISDIAFDPYNVSDGNFHTLRIVVRSGVVAFSIDHRPERRLTYTTNRAFDCWHIHNYYFGAPSPTQTSNYPEFSLRFDGCLRYFTTQGTNGTNINVSTTYNKVSSCDYS
ncbi:hypothetical protein EB796_021034 [Bugula neritina]|uniref:Laminin G domain-containing protein n=1 Tax=Bugula neritina TaxID=10212 RepID=A0A7J7J4L6_BUGNE|nr:hypothetical protein EB796_021034 [Bugula neritina]